MNSKDRFRERILYSWGFWASKNWGKSLLLAFLITIIMGIGMSMLTMEMTFFSIMPGNSSQVEDMMFIIDEFPFSNSITIVVDGREIEPQEKAEAIVKKTVNLLVEEFSKEDYSEYVAEVYGWADPEFFKTHGLILTEPKDIRRFARMYQDLNLTPLFEGMNNDFEMEYSGDEEALEEDEDLAVAQFRGLGKILGLMETAAKGDAYSKEEIDLVLDEFLVGETYFMNRNNRMAMVIVQPTFTINDLGMMVNGVNLVESKTKEIASGQGIHAGLTGITTIGRDEMVTSEQGLALSMTVAFFLILILLIFSFRMVSVPLISGVPLIAGILWTIGMTGFIINRLNILTAMYMIALLGLGIDYAIHLLTTFVQEQDAGLDFSEAVGTSFKKSGSGVITGAMTTAIAFFTLQVAETELMRELGVVAGIGILCELAAMQIIIPGLLGYRHHRKAKKGKGDLSLFKKMHLRSDMASGVGRLVAKSPLVFLLATIVIGGLLGTQSGKVEMETNMMNMEAKGLESIELQDVMIEEFNMSPDGLFILSRDIGEIKDLDKTLKKLDTVRRTESIGPIMVRDSELPERLMEIDLFLSHIEGVMAQGIGDTEALIEEIERMQLNLLEMTDLAFLGGLEKMTWTLNQVTGLNDEGIKAKETSLDRLISLLGEDPLAASRLQEFQKSYIPILKEKLLQLGTAKSVRMEDVPPLYKDSFVSRTGEEFILNIVPTRNPWEGDFRSLYVTQIETVTDKGTGWVLAIDQMSEMAKIDGKRAAMAALIAIFVILFLDFRNLKLAFFTMIPLGFSFLALFGFMGLVGIKFDFINIIAIPLLIGIGVDYAVHISHRYVYEGPGKMELTISKTGTALLLTSLTTIIGFASFIPSVMRAMRSTGIVLSIAMALAFVFSVFLHPSILLLAREKLNLKLDPWKIRKEE